MKKSLCFLALCAAFTLFSNRASAGIPVIYGTGPEFAVKENLPDSIVIDGEHVNFGVAFEQFSIFWIPIWNYGTTEYAFITDDGQSAYSADEEDLEFLNAEYGIDVSESPAIPFWHKIGGKMIWAAVIVFAVWGFGSKKKDEDENEEAAPEKTVE